MERYGMAIKHERWRQLTLEFTHERQEHAAKLRGLFADAASGGTGDLFGESHLNIDSDAEIKQALHSMGHKVPNVRRATLSDLPEPIGSCGRSIPPVFLRFGLTSDNAFR